MFDIFTFYEKICSSSFAGNVFQFASFATVNQYKLPYDVSLRYFQLGDKVLDWGCGNGHFSYFLLEQGAAVTAFSFDEPPAYMLGRKSFSHVRGSIEEPRTLPFETGTFDCVYSIGVLEHVYETGGEEAASLSEIERILKPGGYFLCFHFPNKFGWIEPLGALLKANEHFHNRKYTADDITRLLSNTQFNLLEIGRYNFLPRNQLRRLPAFWRDKAAGVKLINSIDSVFSKVMPMLNQNFYFVARKRVGAATDLGL